MGSASSTTQPPHRSGKPTPKPQQTSSLRRTPALAGDCRTPSAGNQPSPGTAADITWSLLDQIAAVIRACPAPQQCCTVAAAVTSLAAQLTSTVQVVDRDVTQAAVTTGRDIHNLHMLANSAHRQRPATVLPVAVVRRVMLAAACFSHRTLTEGCACMPASGR